MFSLSENIFQKIFTMIFSVLNKVEDGVPYWVILLMCQDNHGQNRKKFSVFQY